MGPGARSAQAERPHTPSGAVGISGIIAARASYTWSVESESLNIGYEIDGSKPLYRLPFESMPLGTFKRWLLYGGPKRANLRATEIIDWMRGAQYVVQKPITQGEAEAFAYHISNRGVQHFTGQVAACLIGGAIAYRTRATMKFPFRSAKPMEKYQNFPSRYMPLATGPAAPQLWHIARANIWAVLCLLVSQPLISVLSNQAMVVGLYRDDRTKDLYMRINEGLDRIRPDKVGARGVTRENAQRPSPEAGSRSPREGENADGSLQGFYPDPDAEDGNGYRETQDSIGDAVYPDDRGEAPNLQQTTNQASWASDNLSQEQRAPASASKRPQQEAYNGSAYGSNSGGGFFNDDDYDDASPTAGNHRDSATQRSSIPRGSAWARVRQENRPNRTGGAEQQAAGDPESQRAGSGSSDATPAWSRQELRDETVPPNSRSQQSPYQRMKQDQNSGDSFSFSKSDADRQLAREQAQKEFNAMLDRERRQSGSDEYERGMRAVESGQESATSSRQSAWEQRRKGN